MTQKEVVDIAETIAGLILGACVVMLAVSFAAWVGVRVAEDIHETVVEAGALGCRHLEEP